MLVDKFRDGNVTAMMDPLRVAKSAFATLPETVATYYFRGNSACYEGKLFDIQTVEKPAKQVLHDQILGPQGRILRLKEVLLMVGLSRSTIWAWDHEGKFPKRRHLGPRSVGWLDTEVYEWIAGRFGNGDMTDSGTTRSL